ncbi:hypothetical protein DPMN_035685 [Dreissena polymorpha]|uniref:HAT C-terminal dimerisation domain-containing protein n=1 Tax=Dreissena polymorpha TaxID=45954 RepID=A0A9D4MB32_DREPO|nr:hypothetical protein DPMN_035685 [Dreissena polymorpha]
MFSVPERFTVHRFLSAHSLAVDTVRLIDAYSVFYYAFLSKSEQKKYTSLYKGILERRQVSQASKEALERMHSRVSKKKMTSEGKERKQKVLQKLFTDRTVTRMMLGIYMSSLLLLKDYAVLFQKKAPMIHVLNDEQLRLVRNFIGYFVKPQCVPSTAKKLSEMDFAEETLLPLSDMFMGSVASKLVTSSKCADVKMVLVMLRTGHIKAGKMLLQKMPINNMLLKTASAVDPSARGHSETIRLLKNLPELVKHILSEEEENKFLQEIYQYQLDPTLPDFNSDTRIDHWWAAQNGYPAMKKIILALVTCFHGPMVEGTFNRMGDILDSKSSSLSIDSLNAIQSVKSALKEKGVSAVEYFHREDTLYTPIVTGLTYNLSYAGSDERNKQLMTIRLEKEEKKKHLDILEIKVQMKRAAHDLVSETVRNDSEDHMANIAKRMKFDC